MKRAKLPNIRMKVKNHEQIKKGKLNRAKLPNFPAKC